MELFRLQSSVKYDSSLPRASIPSSSAAAGLIDIYVCIVNQRVVLQVTGDAAVFKFISLEIRHFFPLIFSLLTRRHP